MMKRFKGNEDSLRIGEVAKIAGVPVVTIRFYEKEKLLKPQKIPAQRTSHRRYLRSAVGEIEFIKTCRAAGLSIPEIRSIIKVLKGFKPPAKPKMAAVLRVIDSLRVRMRSFEEIERILMLRMQDPQTNIEDLIADDPEIYRIRGLKLK